MQIKTGDIIRFKFAYMQVFPALKISFQMMSHDYELHHFL